ncbi:MAG: hypothetical protein JWM52_824 [Candidatus Saccharibacteria bacterium]|nr:hypothetical protein [Candidatus Saccharibacteria bacterium]
MTKYLILIRGINVGGKNKVSMATLREMLEDLEFKNVSTYINSGNVLLESTKNAREVKNEIESALPKNFKLDTALIKVHVLTHERLRKVISDKPHSFGDAPETYYSDAIFLMDVSIDEAVVVFSPREGVDAIWPGDGVIYSQRLGEKRTQSRLSKIVGTPVYKSMTIRSWKTTLKLLDLLEKSI